MPFSGKAILPRELNSTTVKLEQTVKLGLSFLQFLNTKILSPPFRNDYSCQWAVFLLKVGKNSPSFPSPFPAIKLLIVRLVYDVIKKQRRVSKFTVNPQSEQVKRKTS